jgi:translation initiation factor 4E
MEVPESSNLTKLPQEYTLWFTFYKKSKDKQLEEFEDNLKEIGSFGTAEEFWGIYQHMKRPNSLPRGCEFFLFKKGIKPLWEDEANQGGGRFFISVKKNQMNNKLWEEFLIATLMLSSDFGVNGVVLNVRTYEVYISAWTRRVDEEENLEKIRTWMRTSMELPADILVEYKKHPTNDDLIQQQEQNAREDGERKRRHTEVEPSQLPSNDSRLRINSENIDIRTNKHQADGKPSFDRVSEDEEDLERSPQKNMQQRSGVDQAKILPYPGQPTQEIEENFITEAKKELQEASDDI